MHDRMVYRESVRSCPCWPLVSLNFMDTMAKTFSYSLTSWIRARFTKNLQCNQNLNLSNFFPYSPLCYVNCLFQTSARPFDCTIYLRYLIYICFWQGGMYDLGVKPLCGKHEPGRARQTVCYTTRKRPFRGSRQAQQKITHLLCSWWVLLENLGQRRVNIQGIEIRFRFIWW